MCADISISEITTKFCYFIIAVTSGVVEIDKSDKVAAPGARSTDLSQSEENKQASLKKSGNENFSKMHETSQISGVNELCKEDETFTFDTTPLGGQSTEDAGRGLKSFPVLQSCEMLVTLFLGPVLIIDLIFSNYFISFMPFLMTYAIAMGYY